MLVTGLASGHDDLVKLRTPAAVAAAVGAVSLTACSLTAPPPARTTVQSAGQRTVPGPTPARAKSATAAQPATASPSATAAAASTGAAAASVTIAAVGDMMLGTTPDLPPDPATYLDPVKPVLGTGAQIVFGNLEGTLTTATTSKCGPGSAKANCYAFRDPPDYAGYLKDAGFTVLNDANNHSMDFGPPGQAQTVRTIHAAGLAQTGLPGEITLVKANGIRVAFLAFAPYTYTASLLDLPAARALVRQAATEAPVVVVYMHAGAEGSAADHVTGHEENYLGEDRGNPEAFAHLAIDSGASLVIASGPHVLRGMQFYHGHLVAYSLGNFAGYGNFGTDGDLALSAVLHVTLSSTGQFEQARLYPVEDTGKGQPVPGGSTVSFVTRLSQEDFGPSAARISPLGVIQAP
jgi:poly-gamma-glutamate capsule biosynthesis protein CapA/YwtB (metallophosphatase superfamily)